MKWLKYLLLLFAILLSMRAFGGNIPIPSQFVSVIFTIILLIYSIWNNRFGIHSSYLFFFIYLAITIVIANPDPVFKSWDRLAYFSVMLLLIAPIVENQRIRFIRNLLFNYILVIFIFLSIGSFVAYFLGINLMRSDGELDITVAGHFGGLTCQSMTLGPIAGTASCYFLNLFFKQKKKLWVVLAFLSFVTVLMAASRGALIATIGGIFSVVYLRSTDFSSILKKILIVLFIGLVSFPLWEEYTLGVIQKSQDVNRAGMFDSRTTKVTARLAEFESSPIYGVGFASIDPNGIDSFKADTGTIEPGSSLLAIFSMTGIIGFLFVFYLNFQTFKQLRKSNTEERVLYQSIIILFLIHMIIEGYIFSISNPLSIFYWLLLGVSYDTKYEDYSIRVPLIR